MGRGQVVISAHAGWVGDGGGSILYSLRVDIPRPCVQCSLGRCSQCRTPALQARICLNFQYFSQHCFICRHSDFIVSEDAGIELRRAATVAFAVRRSITTPETSYITVPPAFWNVKNLKTPSVM